MQIPNATAVDFARKLLLINLAFCRCILCQHSKSDVPETKVSQIYGPIDNDIRSCKERKATQKAILVQASKFSLDLKENPLLSKRKTNVNYPLQNCAQFQVSGKIWAVRKQEKGMLPVFGLLQYAISMYLIVLHKIKNKSTLTLKLSS